MITVWEEYDVEKAKSKSWNTSYCQEKLALWLPTRSVYLPKASCHANGHFHLFWNASLEITLKSRGKVENLCADWHLTLHKCSFWNSKFYKYASKSWVLYLNCHENQCEINMCNFDTNAHNVFYQNWTNVKR